MCLAVPGRVCALEEESGLRMATVDFDGVRLRVCVETLAEVEAGSWVLVHAGIALQTLDEAAAHRALETLGQAAAGRAREALGQATAGRARKAHATAAAGRAPGRPGGAPGRGGPS